VFISNTLFFTLDAFVEFPQAFIMLTFFGYAGGIMALFTQEFAIIFQTAYINQLVRNGLLYCAARFTVMLAVLETALLCQAIDVLKGFPDTFFNIMYL